MTRAQHSTCPEWCELPSDHDSPDPGHLTVREHALTLIDDPTFGHMVVVRPDLIGHHDHPVHGAVRVEITTPELRGEDYGEYVHLLALGARYLTALGIVPPRNPEIP